MRYPTLPVLVDRTICRALRDLNNSLPPTHPNLGKRKIPAPKELWNAGDVRQMITDGNAAIRRIRSRWQVRGALRSRSQIMLTITLQTQLQVCTFVATTEIKSQLEQQNSAIKALSQRVEQAIPMPPQGHVRQLAHPLSVHPPIEPAGFKSQTSVGLHTQ
jgi:hypothetical protein